MLKVPSARSSASGDDDGGGGDDDGDDDEGSVLVAFSSAVTSDDDDGFSSWPTYVYEVSLRGGAVRSITDLPGIRDSSGAYRALPSASVAGESTTPPWAVS